MIKEEYLKELDKAFGDFKFFINIIYFKHLARLERGE